MRIFATILETTTGAAAAAIARLRGADGIELRLDGFSAAATPDLGALRRLSPLPMIATRRSASGHAGIVDLTAIASAIDAGFDLVDVEYAPGMTLCGAERFASRILLSFHDFEGAPDPLPIVRAMQALGPAAVKIATTPRCFRDNQRLLELLAAEGRTEMWFVPPAKRPAGLTVIGMGGGGLYSRILAPFFGSDLLFVVPDGSAPAAPGQLSLARAREIFGPSPTLPWPRALFAVTGRPAAHSNSPLIHNPRFRAASLPAAYSVLECDSFDDVVWPFTAAAKLAPIGLSITAPFKEEAYRYAVATGAEMTANASEAGAVNTLVRFPGSASTKVRVVAENSDVIAFETAIAAVAGGERVASVAGAGGTARAALAALRRAGIEATSFNRTPRGAAAPGAEPLPLEALAGAGGLLINTLPGHVPVDLGPRAEERFTALIDTAYGGGTERFAPLRGKGIPTFDGLQFLEAQAPAQSALFMEAVRAEMQSGGWSDVGREVLQ